MEDSGAAQVLFVMVFSGLPFRVIPGMVADRLTGPLNLLIPATFFSGIMMILWTLVRTTTGVYLFASAYGMGISTVQSLFSPVLVSLSPDPMRAGTPLGVGNFIVAWAVLIGPPIAGALVRLGDNSFIYAQLWAGSLMCIGGLLLVTARVVKCGLQPRVRV